MASFDFVESASSGYKFVWDERELIARLAIVPLVVKVICFTGVTAFDFEDNYLRQGLFLFPAYIAEGWLVMQILRFALLGERGQINPTGDEEKDLALFNARKRGVMAGTLIYVLTKLLLTLCSSLIFMGGEAQETVKPAQVGDFEAFAIGVAFVMLMIWGFRFVWLYIPAVLDLSVVDFLRKIKAYTSSFSMIGVWLLSFVPFMLLLIIISEMTISVFPGPEENIASEPYRYVMAIAQAILDLIIALVSSVGMAYGIQTIYDGTNKPTPIL